MPLQSGQRESERESLVSVSLSLSLSRGCKGLDCGGFICVEGWCWTGLHHVGGICAPLIHEMICSHDTRSYSSH